MSKISNRAKVTAKGQTTIPIAVRKAMGVAAEDYIEFSLLEGGRVELKKFEAEAVDPVVLEYLRFLESDMIKHPQKLSVLQQNPSLKALLQDVETETFKLD